LEKRIKEAAGIIIGGGSEEGLPAVSELTRCAIDIAKIALTALRDELREKALNVAKAIADYEDELNGQVLK